MRALLSLCLWACTAGVHAQDSQPDPQPAEVKPLAVESLLLDVVITSGGAVAVGERGHILVSQDFETWTQSESVPVSATLTAVAGDGDTLWAVGHDAAIISSADGGLTWSLQHWAPDDQEPLLDVFFIDAQRGFAIGAYGLILATQNGGSAWERVGVSDEDDFHLNAMTRFGDTGLFIAAEAGFGYRSDDLGASWESVEMPYGGSMFGVVAMGDESLLTFGLRGRLQQSEDGGKTWRELDPLSTNSLMGAVASGDKVYAVGANGAILIGTDAGWAEIIHEDGETLASIADIGDGRFVVVGRGGVRVWSP